MLLGIVVLLAALEPTADPDRHRAAPAPLGIGTLTSQLAW
jgi:hypothetical protein